MGEQGQLFEPEPYIDRDAPTYETRRRLPDFLTIGEHPDFVIAETFEMNEWTIEWGEHGEPLHSPEENIRKELSMHIIHALESDEVPYFILMAAQCDIGDPEDPSFFYPVRGFDDAAEAVILAAELNERPHEVWPYVIDSQPPSRTEPDIIARYFVYSKDGYHIVRQGEVEESSVE